MVNLYIFNEANHGPLYGIGTYIHELSTATHHCKLNVCIIHLWSDKKEMQTEETNGIDHWFFPAPVYVPTIDYKNQIDQYFSIVVNQLKIYIEQKNNLIFHLNYQQNGKLAEELKEAFDCRIVTAIHHYNWSDSLLGNITRFKKIIESKKTGQSDEVTEAVKRIYQSEQNYYKKVDHIICLSENTQQVIHVLQNNKNMNSKKNLNPNGLNETINMSVIVPVYNVEDYLDSCIDSLKRQCDLNLEIILVNDGSTDSSGAIADQYGLHDSRIKIIHQENRGLSAAPNVGLAASCGEYVAFVDSDDLIRENSLSALDHTGVEHKADVVMGCFQYYPQGINPFNPIPEVLINRLLSGKEGFIGLIKSGAYPPMVWNYIYRRDYLKQLKISFEEGIIHEDELWTPLALCQASRMVITRLTFYYYRQRQGSIMKIINLRKRLDSLFLVASKLMLFAGRFDFSGEDGELKNWLYVNIFRLYSTTFALLQYVRDTLYPLPYHYLDRFWRDSWEMMPEPQKKCKFYYRRAETELKRYTDRQISDRVASVIHHIKSGKKVMLVYNNIHDEDISLKIDDIPEDWVITTDRRHYQQADMIVFYLPALRQEIEQDLEKRNGQFWVSLYLESEKTTSWFNDPEIRDIFDLWMCYPQDEAQKIHPLVRLCKENETCHG